MSFFMTYFFFPQIVTAAVLAYASAVPSGLLAGAYGAHGLGGLGYGAALGHGAHLGLAAPVAVGHAAVAPTIPPGDIQGQ